MTIPPEERNAAVITHLSGLAGYLVPLAGVLVPLVIMLVKSDSRVISSIARQALYLNIAAWLLVAAFWILFFTVILIPVSILGWAIVGLLAVCLPIIGAIKASSGEYFRYPLVGVVP